MWSSGGLGPPTYRPLEFPYDEYRGGMGEFGTLGGGSATSWAPTPPTTNPIPTSTQDLRNEDSVIIILSYKFSILELALSVMVSLVFKNVPEKNQILIIFAVSYTSGI